jgi:2-haloacid dehalogenase
MTCPLNAGRNVEDAMTTFNRRAVLRGGAALAVSGAAFLRTRRTWAQANPLPEVQALFFDVYGTVVDYRTGVAREAEKILKPLGYSLDWVAFVDAWRAEFQPGMEEIRTGRSPFAKLDILHRRMLDKLKPRFGLDKLDEATQAELTLAWHRVDAWPDVGPGFARLRTRLLLCPCSNGSIAQMADIGRRNDLRWHAILGADIAGDYKPKPRVYLASAEALNLKPNQCMMVAAHSDDLFAAAPLGMRTGHVARPSEGGPGGEMTPKGKFDVMAKDFDDFATKMGT